MQSPIQVTPENVDHLLDGFKKQIENLEIKNRSRNELIKSLENPEDVVGLVRSFALFMANYFDNSAELDSVTRAVSELETIKEKMSSNIIIPSLRADSLIK